MFAGAAEDGADDLLYELDELEAECLEDGMESLDFERMAIGI